MGEVASESTAVGRAVQGRAGDPVGFSRRACGRDARGLGAVRRGFRLVARQRRDHDADGAAGAAQGRLRRRPRDRLHRRRRPTDILIPPSIILVIYAAIAELSVPKLLAAGLMPGPRAHAALHRGGARRWCALRPHYAPGTRELSAAPAHRRAARALAVPRAVHRHHRRHLCRRLQPDRGGLDRRVRRHRARRARPPHCRLRDLRARDREHRWSSAACCSSSSSAPTCSRSSSCRPICRSCCSTARGR